MMSERTGGTVFKFEPKTECQAEAQRAWEKADLLFFIGGPRTGKTHCAMGLALADVKAGKREKVIVCRPMVEAAGEKVGFLKGTLSDKTEPWMGPIHDVLGKLVYNLPQEWIEKASLAHLRGRTVSNSVLVLDEGQNCTYAMLKLVLTRMGKGAKVVVAADPDQADNRPTRAKYPDTDLELVMELMGKVAGVAVVEFPIEQSVGHPIATAAAKLL